MKQYYIDLKAVDILDSNNLNINSLSRACRVVASEFELEQVLVLQDLRAKKAIIRKKVISMPKGHIVFNGGIKYTIIRKIIVNNNILLCFLFPYEDTLEIVTLQEVE